MSHSSHFSSPTPPSIPQRSASCVHDNCFPHTTQVTLGAPLCPCRHYEDKEVRHTWPFVAAADSIHPLPLSQR